MGRITFILMISVGEPIYSHVSESFANRWYCGFWLRRRHVSAILGYCILKIPKLEKITRRHIHYFLNFSAAALKTLTISWALSKPSFNSAQALSHPALGSYNFVFTASILALRWEFCSSSSFRTQRVPVALKLPILRFSQSVHLTFPLFFS